MGLAHRNKIWCKRALRPLVTAASSHPSTKSPRPYVSLSLTRACRVLRDKQGTVGVDGLSQRSR